MNCLKTVFTITGILLLYAAVCQPADSPANNIEKMLSGNLGCRHISRPVKEPDRKISGTVTDTAGKPIPFASVMITGQWGLPADSLGNFELSVPDARKSFTASAVGYQAATIDITDSATYVVKLTESPTLLPPFEISQSGSRCALRCGIRGIRVRCNKRIAAAPSPATANIRVFPNPAARGGIITIQSPGFNIRNVQLFDNAIRPIKLFHLDGTKTAARQLRLPDHLPAGIYYLVVNDAETKKIHTQKLLIL